MLRVLQNGCNDAVVETPKRGAERNGLAKKRYRKKRFGQNEVQGNGLAKTRHRIYGLAKKRYSIPPVVPVF